MPVNEPNLLAALAQAPGYHQAHVVASTLRADGPGVRAGLQALVDAGLARPAGDAYYADASETDFYLRLTDVGRARLDELTI